jgi:3',5'-cyclic AMP phosphodiesterase CpdA
VKPKTRILQLIFSICAGLALSFAPVFASAQVRIAQLSDIHIGEPRAPHAFENLRKAVDMVNARHPDAVVVSGDIGENPHDWDLAKGILKWLKAPVYYAPGNHDVHAHDLGLYRAAFGPDYYRFHVKDIDFVVIDSQLLGNYEEYEMTSPPSLPADTEMESRRMLAWLEKQTGAVQGRVTIGIQHVPAFRDHDFPDIRHPYWVISDPYRTQEVDLLHKLGIKDMLVGHWHSGRIFTESGITWRVAPATSWLPWGGELGFALHTISPDGHMETEFVTLPDTEP